MLYAWFSNLKSKISNLTIAYPGYHAGTHIQAHPAISMHRKPSKNAPSRVHELENPCKIRCFPQGEGIR